MGTEEEKMRIGRIGGARVVLKVCLLAAVRIGVDGAQAVDGAVLSLQTRPIYGKRSSEFSKRSLLDDDVMLPTTPEPFNLRAALTELAKYEQEHPGFFQGVAFWVALGVILYVIAVTGLLYSEIRACLVVRDQDFRVRLLETQACVAGARLEEAKEAEAALLAPRAYILFIVLLLFILAIAAILFPLCDIFMILGLPSGPCLLMLTLGSLLAAVSTVTGWMALVWSCTRPFAAVVLACISVSGQIMIPSGDALIILLWVLCASVGTVLYFYLLPHLCADKSWGRPVWLQDIGLVSVSLDPGEWSNAFSRSYEAHEAEIHKDQELSMPSIDSSRYQ